MFLCALNQSFCTSLEVPLQQPLACFLPIHSHHVPDILPLHLLLFPFVFHFSLFTLLILLWILFLIHFHCSFFTYFPEQNLGIPYIPTQIMMMMMMMMMMLLLLMMMMIIPHDISLSFLLFQRMFSMFLTVWATTAFIRGWTLVKFETTCRAGSSMQTFFLFLFLY